MPFVNFIGPPCSGKTTVAAGLFSRLKKYGLATEYVSEYARQFIAKRKTIKRPLILNNIDQLTIMEGQLDQENLFIQDNVTLITDTSPVNSLLYLDTPDKESSEFICSEYLYSSAMSRKGGIYFCCSSVPIPGVTDPNRIHDADDIFNIEKKVAILLEKIQKTHPETNIHWLTENQDNRIDIATGIVLRESIKLCYS